MATARTASPTSSARESTKALLLIALFKLVKGVLLLAVGIGAIKLLHSLLLTEGTGLLFRKRWAEYFTIITTAGLIPGLPARITATWRRMP